MSAVARSNSANTFSVAPQTINIDASVHKGLIIKGAASQVSNLQEWQNSTGTILSSIDKDGNLMGSATFTVRASVLNVNGVGDISIRCLNPDNDGVGDGGSVNIAAGRDDEGTPGNVSLIGGGAKGQQSGYVYIHGGDGNDNSNGGNVVLEPGTGTGGDKFIQPPLPDCFGTRIFVLTPFRFLLAYYPTEGPISTVVASGQLPVASKGQRSTVFTGNWPLTTGN